jgi:glutamine synthetase
MLRVIGGANDKATRIENRMGEPAANPYLYLASQIYAGLDGIQRQLTAPPATTAPYATDDARLPGSLGQALDALNRDEAYATAFGEDVINHYTRIRQQEITRHEAAADKNEWQRREYFGRI